jgi:hypothetical protein
MLLQTALWIQFFFFGSGSGLGLNFGSGSGSGSSILNKYGTRNYLICSQGSKELSTQCSSLNFSLLSKKKFTSDYCGNNLLHLLAYVSTCTTLMLNTVSFGNNTNLRQIRIRKLIKDPDPNMQIISDPAGFGYTTLLANISEDLGSPMANLL